MMQQADMPPLQEKPQKAASSSGEDDDNDENGSSGAPLNQAIRIFARIRPRRANPNIKSGPGASASKIVVDGPVPSDEGQPQLHFHMPRNETQGLINNMKEHFGFRFDRVFDEATAQEEVFDHVAKDTALSVLDGFNATIFAYGQTGSGKTFTITGGAEKYADRGLIPRTIQFIFKEIAKRSNRKHEVNVSYLELYNENGYDLLDDSRDAKGLEDLPKVILRENEDQTIYLQNLSMHPSVSEEEALNWLFVGDTNKMIAETPSNPASSRSHCLFILTITSREEGSEVLRRAKLHLVDLAGSERVAKTGIDGTLLKEARHINLSLHYLEQVIVALHEKALAKRTHIPYRNSMMTSILRDSLGGNCKTAMIATLATEEHLLEESISTCRFAQRVALISNRVSANEEVDPQLIIAKLKRKIAQLKAELALARGEAGDPDGELPEYEVDRIRELVSAYMSGDDSTLIFTDYRKVMAAMRLLRDQAQGKPPPNPQSDRSQLPQSPKPISVAPQADPDAAKEISRLKRLVMQRDTEIGVLIPMVNQYKTKVKAIEKGESSRFASTDTLGSQISLPSRINSVPSAFSVAPASDSGIALSQAPIQPIQPEDRTVLLEAFKSTYIPMKSIEEQKAQLKGKYAEAKELGKVANDLRQQIKQSKEKMSCIRADYEVAALKNPSLTLAANLEAEEARLRQQIGDFTTQYRSHFQKLKELKIEIEHVQHLLETAKIRLNTDFEAWLRAQRPRGDTADGYYGDTQDSRTSVDSRISTRLRPTTPSSTLDSHARLPAWGTPPPHYYSTGDIREASSALAEPTLSRAPAQPSTSYSRPSSRLRSEQTSKDITAFYQARDRIKQG